MEESVAIPVVVLVLDDNDVELSERVDEVSADREELQAGLGVLLPVVGVA